MAAKCLAMITFRTAIPDDIPLLHHWDEQPHLQETVPDNAWQWAEELSQNQPWREQLIAELDGRPIGFVQIIDPAEDVSHYWGDEAPHQRAIDIWIGEANDLNKGHGTRMMALALKRCFHDPLVWRVLIDPYDSNTKAHRFYERIGYEYLDHRHFDDDYCKVYAMTRQRWEATRAAHTA